MKITLEFDSPKEYFEQLPKFAALQNFAGKFADFKDGEQIEDPDLPQVERTSGHVTIHADSTEGRTKEEVSNLINEAVDDAEALDATSKQDAKPENEPEPEPKPEPKSEPKPEPKPEPQEPPKPKATAPEIRAAMNSLIKKGKRDKVTEILEGYNAAKFTEVNPKYYDEFLAKIEGVLKNG